MENVKNDALSMKGQTIVGRSFVRLTSLVPEEYSENFAYRIPIETELKDKDCKFCPDIAFYRLLTLKRRRGLVSPRKTVKSFLKVPLIH